MTEHGLLKREILKLKAALVAARGEDWLREQFAANGLAFEARQHVGDALQWRLRAHGLLHTLQTGVATLELAAGRGDVATPGHDTRKHGYTPSREALALQLQHTRHPVRRASVEKRMAELGYTLPTPTTKPAATEPTSGASVSRQIEFLLGKARAETNVRRKAELMKQIRELRAGNWHESFDDDTATPTTAPKETELDAVRAAMRAERDPVKRHALAMKARELRGQKNLFGKDNQ